jgi:hypothetical protein
MKPTDLPAGPDPRVNWWASQPEGHPMTFEGPCILVKVTETQWYVAVPPVAEPGEYRVVSSRWGAARRSRPARS